MGLWQSLHPSFLVLHGHSGAAFSITARGDMGISIEVMANILLPPNQIVYPLFFVPSFYFVKTAEMIRYLC